MRPTRRFFRQQLTTRGILAIEPRALDVELDVPEPQDSEDVEHAGIKVINIRGPLEHHSCWFWDSYDEIRERVQEAFDDHPRAVVLRIDSPGGDASGVGELHKSLRKMRSKSNIPLIAFVDECAASAAYAIASACDEIWLPAAGSVGSIGVIGTIVDRTAKNQHDGIRVELITTGSHKADGHPDNPITDSAITEMQRRVDELGMLFFRTVAESRHLSIDAVKAFQARVLTAKRAVKAGLADGIASWEKFLSRVGAADAAPSKTQSGVEDMKTLAELIAMLRAAKTEQEVAAISAQIIEAKYKKTKKVDKTETTEESDEDEDAEDEDEGVDAEDEDEGEEAEADEESDAGSTSTGHSTSTGADDEKKSKSLLHSKSGLYTHDRLFRHCKELTGKSDVVEVFGALSALHEQAKMGRKLAKRTARLETLQRGSVIDKLLSAARREGRLTKNELPTMRADAMEKGPKWLKSRLELRPKLVRTSEDAATFEHGQVVASTTGLTPDQLRMAEMSARADGVPAEKRIEEISQRLAASAKTPRF